MKLMNFGEVMKRSAYLLVSLFALAATSIAADESVVLDENVTLNEELASLQRRSRGLDVASNPKDRVSVLDQQMNEVYTDTVRDTFGAKAASARPQIDSYNIYLSGDAIYWKAFEGGSDYASETHSTAAPFSGQSKRADFNWRWGFKAALGYRTPHDDWDLAAHYTWFFDKANDTASAPAGGGITPLFTYFYTAAASSAKVNWWLHFDDADLSIQKSYFLSRSFSLSPFAALRSTWINQKLVAHYFAPATVNPNVDQTGKNDFWGIGPKVGVSSRWFAGPHWNFFGSCAGSLLYGEFDVRSKTFINGNRVTNLNADLHRIVPTVQASLGFGWEMNFLKHYHIAANVAYEAQYWWRQNELYSYSNIATPILRRFGEDLGLHGLTINALFDF